MGLSPLQNAELPRGNGKFAGDILGPAEAKGPVIGSVFDVPQEDILPRDADLAELGGDGSEQGLLGFATSTALGEDLDHDHAGTSLETQAGILGNNLALEMLGDDVEVVALGDAILGEDGVVDSLTEFTELLRRTAFVDVNADEGICSPSIVCPDILTNYRIAPQALATMTPLPTDPPGPNG
ncbi:hypothetical protein AHiyo8_22240 [Arthrobacter sp. Hiyo8]|nr:hypothetical protein AHiyo8_22240 [Arthrobacter sp. Hiyo8]